VIHRKLFTSVCMALTLSATFVATSTVAWADSEPNDKRPVYLDRMAHASAEDTCTPGFIWQGAGNPNSTFQRKRNLEGGVELAIKGIRRQGPDIRSTYVDGGGLVHIEVPTGPQPTNSSRAAWNFTYSYDVALDPDNGSLADYEGQLWIDLDPSEHTEYLKLKLASGGPVQSGCPLEPDWNGYQWVSGHDVVIPDDEGTNKVTQNSQNYAFYTSAIDSDPNMPGIQPYTFGPAQFDVVMILKKKGAGGDGASKTTTLHVVFDVVAAPTQTP
jgi:hypothetical protein